MSSWDPTPPAAFRGGDSFCVTPAGRVAEASYRAGIVTARGEPGRAAFDDARAAWALSLGLEPDDGVYLGELRREAVKVSTLIEALVVCGKTRTDAMEALARLVDAEFVERRG